MGLWESRERAPSTLCAALYLCPTFGVERGLIAHAGKGKG